MLLREEFQNTIGYISESVDTVIVTAQDMMDSSDLKQILYMVLVTGNFLNSVSAYSLRHPKVYLCHEILMVPKDLNSRYSLCHQHHLIRFLRVDVSWCSLR